MSISNVSAPGSAAITKELQNQAQAAQAAAGVQGDPSQQAGGAHHHHHAHSSGGAPPPPSGASQPPSQFSDNPTATAALGVDTVA